LLVERWTPDQQRTTPLSRRIAQHPGNAGTFEKEAAIPAASRFCLQATPKNY
jgi:hypothetical protein